MAEVKKNFWDDLDSVVKTGGLSLLTFLILRSGEGRRAVRQLQRLTGVSLTRASIEGGVALTHLREWGTAERDRILSHGVAAVGAVVLFGLLCICAAAMVPNFFLTDPMTAEAARRGALAEGLAISMFLATIIILLYGIMMTVIPIWAIGSALAGLGKTAGSVELTPDGFKKAPAWFFGTLSGMGSEVAVQVAALYRWFTRIIGWVGLSSGYIWIVPFHRTPELLAGLAIPIISVFYAFNQGWRGEKEFLERGSVWKAIVISTALVMLNMAVLASYPAYFDALLLGHFWPVTIFWGLVLIQLVMVYRWSTGSGSADGTAGSYRAKAPGTSPASWIAGAALIGVVGLIAWLIFGTVLRNEMDVEHHRPVPVVQNEMGRRLNGWLPGVSLTPERTADGGTIFRPGISMEPPAVEGDGHFTNTVLALQVLGANPDSFMVAPNAAVGAWQVIARTVGRGDTINYRYLDKEYLYNDREQGQVAISVEGLRNDTGELFYPRQSQVTERYVLSRRAHYGALVMRLGTGRTMEMLYPDGYLALTDRVLPVGDQQLMLGFNLMQTEPVISRSSGTVRIIIWIDRKHTA